MNIIEGYNAYLYEMNVNPYFNSEFSELNANKQIQALFAINLKRLKKRLELHID